MAIALAFVMPSELCVSTHCVGIQYTARMVEKMDQLGHKIPNPDGLIGGLSFLGRLKGIGPLR
jgi:hypothetical protein